MSRGIFITFEGGEGSGKTTQIRRLEKHLTDAGHRVLVTREPGGTELAEAIRGILLDPALDPDGMSELLLFEAARHDHVERLIRPTLEARTTVLCDRFADSSTVYQGSVRHLGIETVADLNRFATGGLVPDLTLVFDIDPRVGLKRVHERNAATANDQDRIDTLPPEFHEAVRAGFQQLAASEPERVRLVDAAGSPDEVFERMLTALPGDLR
jgi:dTMP kinase